MQNERQKNGKHGTVENVRSIGPMTFKARSNSNLNIQHKQTPTQELWHVVDKKERKPIKVDNNNNNNNYMNLYNKNNESEIKEMQLEKTAIGDIEKVACNEDETIRAVQNKQQNEEELSESVIDRDKSVYNKKTAQTDDAAASAGKVQAHNYAVWNVPEQAEVSEIANEQSALQMTGNVNRSRKQRRNLPEMKFGHRRDAVADGDGNGDDVDVDMDVDNASSNEYGIKTATALSSPAIAVTPEKINDYKNDYLNIFSIRSNTSTPNVRLPLGYEQNKVLNGK